MGWSHGDYLQFFLLLQSRHGRIPLWYVMVIVRFLDPVAHQLQPIKLTINDKPLWNHLDPIGSAQVSDIRSVWKFPTFRLRGWRFPSPTRKVVITVTWQNLVSLCVCACVCARVSVCLLCLCLSLQEKITKEMNYILSNQETVLTQITQLESAITQTEVGTRFNYMLLFLCSIYAYRCYVLLMDGHGWNLLPMFWGETQTLSDTQFII